MREQISLDYALAVVRELDVELESCPSKEAREHFMLGVAALRERLESALPQLVEEPIPIVIEGLALG